MSPELERRLAADFPRIFPHGAPCECENGWYPLIHNLCACVQSYLDDNPHLGVPQVVAVQVKEKYGTLRFLYDGGDETVAGMVWFASFLSARTCEVTGRHGRLCVRSGWYKTLCADEAAARDYAEVSRPVR